jgi:hypothetical protein
MKKKHDWNTWENYLRVHESVLRKYQSHFITQNPKYSISELTDQYYQLKLDKLELKTLKGTVITINIEKDIEVQPGWSPGSKAGIISFVIVALMRLTINIITSMNT